MDLKTIRKVLLWAFVICAMWWVYVSGLTIAGHIDSKLAYILGGVLVWIFWVAFE